MYMVHHLYSKLLHLFITLGQDVTMIYTLTVADNLTAAHFK